MESKESLPVVPSPEEANKDEGSRGQWSSKTEFMLSTIGFAVDLAVVWRFPYLCYRNGGGTFLIPYFLILILGAMPLLYMEQLVGQKHRRGALTVWKKIIPLFSGLGYLNMIPNYLVSIYYNVVMGYAFYYMFASMSKILPWDSCNNEYNTPNCIPMTLANGNLTITNTSVSAAQEYFERGFLKVHLSQGITDLGPLVWYIVLPTLLTFVILFFALIKGVHSSGKVVWVTAIAPYVLMLTLLIRGLLLKGSLRGVMYFIEPTFHRLLDIQVWVDAAVQIFYTLGVGFGVHLTFSSYNDYHNNCFRDCVITVVANGLTAVLSGLVVFTYLGYMSIKFKQPIQTVATEGHGLVFVVYPEAMSTLPLPQLWSILFFSLLIMLGMDSSMGGLEAVLTAVKDEMPGLMKRFKYSRQLLVFLMLLSSFFFSLLCCTWGGYFVVRFLDTYSAGITLLLAALLQSIVIGWFYGLDSFTKDAKDMQGKEPSLYWRLSWKLVSPIFVLSIMVASSLDKTKFVEKFSDRIYFYPKWILTFGSFLSIFPLFLVIGFAIYSLIKAKGTVVERIAQVITPVNEQNEITQAKSFKRFQLKHWLSLGGGKSLMCHNNRKKVTLKNSSKQNESNFKLQNPTTCNL